MPGEVKDQIKLVVDGRARSDWSTLEVDSDLFIPADDFKFTLDDWTLDQLAEIKLPRLAKVFVNGYIVLTGDLTTRAPGIKRGQRRLILSGRDLAGRLVKHCPDPATWSRLTLGRAAQNVCEPLGDILVNQLGEGSLDKPFEKMQIEPGETAWAFLARYAELRGAGMWMDPSGMLCLGKLPEEEIRKRLYLSDHPATSQRNNILEWEAPESLDPRFAVVKVVAQRQGNWLLPPDATSGIKAQAEDEELKGLPDQLIIPHQEIEDALTAKEVAERQIRLGRVEGWQISCRVKGFTQKGTPWQAGERVWVEAPALGLNQAFLVYGRTFRYDRQNGATTSLRLCRPGMWP